MWPYFERMRKEAPVHYCAKSQFGPYWSLTKFADIMHTDTNHQVFSSDSKIGGISLGGGADPDPQFDLPMFIQEDPPKHEAQRKVVAHDVHAAQPDGSRTDHSRTRRDDSRQPAAQRRLQLGAPRLGGLTRQMLADAVRHSAGRLATS